MMGSDLHNTFLQLVRLGISHTENTDNTEIMVLSSEEWAQLKALADEQGLSAIVLDGIEKLSANQRPPQVLLLEWIGQTLQEEAVFASQQQEAAKMAALFHQNHIKTYVLKGVVVAECYPKPNHRVSVDLDCYLLPDEGDFDAWTLGNDLIASKGFEVSKDFYKNSTFLLSELTVESHQFLTPFRGNKTLKKLEAFLQSQLIVDSLEFKDSSLQSKAAEPSAEVERKKIEGTELWRPPVMVSALFLIEHAYSHFLHEGLTWRMVLDWMLFSKKHKDEINWAEFDAFIGEFGFGKFYDSFSRLGLYLIGELKEFSRLASSNEQPKVERNGLSVQDERMLEDIWAPLDVHETIIGVKGKLALVGNTWRARWKYHHFAEITWIQALWIQTKGFLFEKNPKLD